MEHRRHGVAEREHRPKLARLRKVIGFISAALWVGGLAQKAIQGGVHGLIAVNSVAGGHAGRLSPEALFDQLADLGLPVICAGGVGDPPGRRADAPARQEAAALVARTAVAVS